MMKIVRTISFITISTVFLTCTEEKVTPRAYPRVLTHPVSNITPGGATFNGEIFFTLVEVIDYGFVWSDAPSQQLGNTDYVSLGSRSNTGTFSAKIERSLEEGKTHYVRAYAQSAENTVYGPVQEFVSLGSKAPSIEDFEPKTGTWGDTIQIKGKNFSQVSGKNRVLLEDVETQIAFNSDTLLKIVVPQSFINSIGKIKVVVAGNSGEPSGFFELESALINGFKPDSANYGVPFSITGSLFSKNFTKVYFNDVEINALTVNDSLNIITFEVPKGLTVGFQDVKVVIGDRTITAAKQFFRATPTIKMVDPESATYGETVTITGKYFAPDINENSVRLYFEGDPIRYHEVQKVESSTTRILVKIPNQYVGYAPKIGVTVNNDNSNNVLLNIPKPFIESIIPSSGLLPGSKVLITGRNFPMGGSAFELYVNGVRINNGTVAVNSHEELSFNFPSDAESHSIQLSVNMAGKIGDFDITTSYVPLTKTKTSYGSRSFLNFGDIYQYNPSDGGPFWKYNLASNSWSELPAVSESGNGKNFFVLHFDGAMYMGDQSVVNPPIKNFHKYTFAANTWEQKTSIPNAGITMASYSIGDYGYVMWAGHDGVSFTGKFELWKFDSATESWSFLAPFTHETNYRSQSFAISFVSYGELFYTVANYDGKPAPEPLWHFNLETLEWSKKDMDFLSDIQHVPYNGKSYILANEYGTSNSRIYEIDKTSLEMTPSEFPDIPISLLKGKAIIENGNKLLLINQNTIWEYDPQY
jgi:hypothetical protein